MSKRLFGIIGTLWIVFGPFLAFWAMWNFAFKTITHYYVGNALIALILVGPPLAMFLLYRRYAEVRGD